MADPDPGGSGHLASPVVISVCTSCRGSGEAESDRPGERLLASLRQARDEAGSDVIVRPVQCLSVCSRPCTVALASPGRYTYVFGDLDPATDAAALIDGARIYAEQEHGYMLWRERPEPLRRGIVARIPPPAWESEDGRHPR